MILYVLAILLLLGLSALASGSETAMTGSSRGWVHQLAANGHRRAAILEKLLNRKEQVLSTILLANNIVNILAAALATDVFIQLVGEVGVAYATIIMTLLVVVFAEVLPKTYAVQNADRLALAIAPLLQGLLVAFTPLTAVIGWIVRRLIVLLGLDAKGSAGETAADEVRGAVAYFGQQGWLAKSKRQMLEGVLDLDGVSLEAVMTHRSQIFAIDIESDLRDVLGRLRTCPFSRVPVWRGNSEHIVGILHIRDLVGIPADGSLAASLAELAQPAYFVPESTTLLNQFRAFQQRSSHMALVVDEYGSLQGLVTIEDILEEIVGEIWDERDVRHGGIERTADGRAVVDAMLTVREVNRELDWDLPEHTATTIGGLVTVLAGRIPEAGDSFREAGYVLEVTSKLGHQLATVTITRER